MDQRQGLTVVSDPFPVTTTLTTVPGTLFDTGDLGQKTVCYSLYASAVSSGYSFKTQASLDNVNWVDITCGDGNGNQQAAGAFILVGPNEYGTAVIDPSLFSMSTPHNLQWGAALAAWRYYRVQAESGSLTLDPTIYVIVAGNMR